jgi:hypothetical protein
MDYSYHGRCGSFKAYDVAILNISRTITDTDGYATRMLSPAKISGCRDAGGVMRWSFLPVVVNVDPIASKF